MTATSSRRSRDVWPMARWAVLRLLPPDGQWASWDRLILELQQSPEVHFTDEFHEWYLIARRECIALEEIEQRGQGGTLWVRLTEKGLIARAVETETTRTWCLPCFQRGVFSRINPANAVRAASCSVCGRAPHGPDR